jgi:type IV secretory pathway VirB2 component (pilin)
VRSGFLAASLRILGTVIAGLVIIAGVFDGSLGYALAVGVVVGGLYALAGAAYDRFDGS